MTAWHAACTEEASRLLVMRHRFCVCLCTGAALLLLACGGGGVAPPQQTPVPERPTTPVPGASLVPPVSASPAASPRVVTSPVASPVSIQPASSPADVDRLLDTARAAAEDVGREAEAAAQEPNVSGAAIHGQAAGVRAATVRDALTAARQGPGLSADAQSGLDQTIMRATQLVNEVTGLISTPSDGSYSQRGQRAADLARQIIADIDRVKSSR